MPKILSKFEKEVRRDNNNYFKNGKLNIPDDFPSAVR